MSLKSSRDHFLENENTEMITSSTNNRLKVIAKEMIKYIESLKPHSQCFRRNVSIKIMFLKPLHKYYTICA